MISTESGLSGRWGVGKTRKSTRSGPYSDNCVEMTEVRRLGPAQEQVAPGEARGISVRTRAEIESALAGVALTDVPVAAGEALAVVITDSKDLNPKYAPSHPEKLVFDVPAWTVFVDAVRHGYVGPHVAAVQREAIMV